MEQLQKLQKALNSIDVLEIAVDIFERFSPQLVKLNKEQMLRGEDSESFPLPDVASASYANYKSSIGSKSVPRYDFKVTGKFQDAMYGIVERAVYYIDSKDEKRDRLVSLSSVEIFGVQDNSLDNWLNTVFVSEYEKELEKRLQVLR